MTATRQQINFSSALRILVALAALVVIIAGLRTAQSIVVPFLLSAFIAIILLGPLKWLGDKGLSRWVSLLIVTFGCLVVVFLCSSLIGNSIDQFRTSLPSYQQKLDTELAGVYQLLDKIGIDTGQSTMTEALSPGKIMGYASDILGNLAALVANGLLILLTVAFILAEVSVFPAKIRLSADDPETTLNKVAQFTTSANKYMATKASVSALTAIAVAIILALIGVDFPVLWGVLAFFLNFVPNIGSIFAAVPAIILAFIQLGSGAAIATAISYLAINLIVGNLIEPKYMGKSVGLSTLVVFLSLIFWGWVLGPVGMLLSVPLTMMVKISLSENPETSWISSLLGNDIDPLANTDDV